MAFIPLRNGQIALGASMVRYLKYEWIWSKSRPTGFMNARRMPLKAHENVLVFYDKLPLYNPQNLITVNVKNSRKNKSGNGNYGKIGIDEKEYFTDQGNFPRSIMEFSVDSNLIHPTQKPVALFEYLIRTYTNEGDTVLDNCLGSGTTAIAAENTGRRWIGIERDPGYFGAACERIASR